MKNSSKLGQIVFVVKQKVAVGNPLSAQNGTDVQSTGPSNN